MKIIEKEIAAIGVVKFERSKRARYLNISVKPFKGVRVAVPYGVSFKKAEEIVYSKTNWLIKQLGRMKRFETELNARTSKLTPIKRTEAKKRLTARLNELASRLGFSYNRVFIRNQKTRWGSCSAANNISLNMKLLNLPEELIDYVLMHELVHTRIKNHRKEFWAALEKLVPDSKALRAKLKNYHLYY